MATASRGATLRALLRGMVAAIAITLAGMVLLAVFVMYAAMSDGALVALNQVLKLIAIFLGALAAIRPGGRRGFALGASVGLAYMALGYALYCAMDGGLVSAGTMVIEFALGALLGAICGAIISNMRSGRRAARA